MKDKQVCYMNAGDVFVSKKGTVLSTVLGPCVSVCLYSEEYKVGGMTHCSSSLKRIDAEGNEIYDLKNCDTSIYELLNGVESLIGHRPDDLCVKIVGGASISKNKNSIGHKVGISNLDSVKETIKSLNIPIKGQDIGGHLSRRIFFDTSNGRLIVKNNEQTDKESRSVTQKQKQKVLIVDDSKVIRNILSKIISHHPNMEVVGTCENAIVAEKKIYELKPDVVTLDINMPIVDGVSFIEKFLPNYPIPIVLVSALNARDSDRVLRGLELGAVDYIKKPDLKEINSKADFICEHIYAASQIDFSQIKNQNKTRAVQKLEANQSVSKNNILAIGASTGGTEALKDVLVNMPDNIPPTVIVQHIPPVFSKAFAERLNSLCRFEIKEAQDNDEIIPNRVLIAPGGKQMRVKKIGKNFIVKLSDDSPVNRHRPSVDYLFNSLAKNACPNVVGVILTGMGEDGAKGLLELKKRGAQTIVQSEKTCVVFGMPKAAIRLKAEDSVHDLEEIPNVIVELLNSKEKAA